MRSPLHRETGKTNASLNSKDFPGEGLGSGAGGGDGQGWGSGAGGGGGQGWGSGVGGGGGQGWGSGVGGGGGQGWGSGAGGGGHDVGLQEFLMSKSSCMHVCNQTNKAAI
ncbi:hypothetical protein BaRGS_00019226 [Batillaria attramentaria]|uniref:Uncharacterized protein n=1 Tax=Batillaria attramentaria TaxID=370345 RepID=A0ABD0KQX2_9CAEN